MPTYEENAMAEAMACLPWPTCYSHMSDGEYLDGCQQMLADLRRLAADDGCIAAAWAMSVLERAVPLAELAVAIQGTINEQGGFYDDNSHALDEIRAMADKCFECKPDSP